MYRNYKNKRIKSVVELANTCDNNTVKGYKTIKANQSIPKINKDAIYTQHDIEQLEHEKELLLSEIKYIDKQIRQIKKIWKH